MTIDRGNFEQIDLNDLQELVQVEVPESLRLEYKSEIYGNSDSDKRELLKDVSSFANAHGGHLILGIQEANGIATKLVGVKCDDPDAEILRMVQILRSGIEPVISGTQIKALPLDKDRCAFLLRIPRSWNPPHRVIAKNINRFYMRHSAGIHEPSIEELRILFSQSSTALEAAKAFRDERIRSIYENEGPRPLIGNGRLIIHIIPTAAFSGMVNINIGAAHEAHQHFRPLASMGMTPRFNYYGFINERGGDDNYGYTQVFRNGSLEATMANLVRERDGSLGIPGLKVERSIFEVLSSYIFGLRDIGVPPPLIIMITFEGVGGAHYHAIRNDWDGYYPTLPNDLICLPECFLEDYGEPISHHRAVRPAFDALWNAIGYSEAQLFNEEGQWIDRP